MNSYKHSHYLNKTHCRDSACYRNAQPIDAALSHAAVAQQTLACHSTKTTSLVFQCVPMASCTCHGSVLLQESIHGSRQRAELVQPKTPLKHLMTAREAFGSAAHKELLAPGPLVAGPVFSISACLCSPFSQTNIHLWEKIRTGMLSSLLGHPAAPALLTPTQAPNPWQLIQPLQARQAAASPRNTHLWSHRWRKENSKCQVMEPAPRVAAEQTPAQGREGRP